ncbi:response regulator transcription factor [Actinophytocola oryzae]|uniref:DNA-binding NarL/FixJ family response regulator n=1 Tax=Actinophytocola oryzae TaxID=502181 RepID=A0A4R7USA8_9PSEU|nr:LuxR C-terminal-related transcriptional regulator [Actinophytocola oryzae]TDV38614.1 DNA-binding NarL/FixJ family response regulator [Actinophytocola oryzae]
MRTEQCVRVVVLAADVLSCAGLTRYLESLAEVTLLEPDRRAEADVVLFAPECLSPGTFAALRRESRAGKPIVLVANDVSEADLLVAVECGVRAILSRAMATGDRLRQSVVATAARGGLLPPDLLGEVLHHVNYLQNDVLSPKGLNAAGLKSREIDVVRLMAEGLDTAEIASELSYSERTVKNMIYRFTSRLQLRSRPHAVAYALRAGVI